MLAGIFGCCSKDKSRLNVATSASSGLKEGLLTGADKAGASEEAGPKTPSKQLKRAASAARTVPSSLPRTMSTRTAKEGATPTFSPSSIPTNDELNNKLSENLISAEAPSSAPTSKVNPVASSFNAGSLGTENAIANLAAELKKAAESQVPSI